MKHTENFHRCENCGHIWPMEKSQTSHNSDYTKCLDELQEAVKWNGWGEKYVSNLIDILKKHFA